MVTPSSVELQFQKRLEGTPAQLFKKLKVSLSINSPCLILKQEEEELKTIGQETMDVSSLKDISQQLIDPSIVNHKDKGVRIYAACCIAGTLRICISNALYKQSLKTIFELFVGELRHVANPSSSYFDAYYNLLESLSAVRNIVLLTHIKNFGGIMIDLFRNIFDIIRPQQAKNMHICMSNLLQNIIYETKNLPQEIVDILLAQFLHKQKFDNPAAYRLACELCKACADKLQRYVFQYFSDIISTTEKEELTSKDMADLQTVHQLAIELNKGAPTLLLSVIPQLEEELKLSDVAIRALVTKSLGEMFAEPSSQLATQYESTWKTWLQRRNDKVPQVRIVWIESLVSLIKTHGNLAKELSEGLAEKLVDPDEKVRAIACKTIGKFDYETSLHHIQKNTLIQVGHRCRDKKKLVSKEAIHTLSVLYNQAYPEIEIGTQASISHFTWMPSAILHAVYVNDNEISSYVDNAVFTTLFPPQGNTVSRAHRLITTFAALDDKGRTGLLSVLRRSVDARYYMAAFLQLLKTKEASTNKDVDSEEYEKKLNAVIKILCDRLPDPVKSSLLLHKYAQLHDDKFYKLIYDCMDSKQPLKEIKKTAKELLSRIENVSPQIFEVFSILIQRISLTLVNSEILSELIKSIGDDEEYRLVSGELLRSISLIFPAIFRDHLVEITSMLRDSEFPGASDSLYTLAEFAKQFPKSVPADAKAKETLRSFLESGMVVQARHATIVLASIPDNDRMCKEIADSIVERLVITSTSLQRDLAVLSQLALFSPQVFETISSSVISFIIKKLLMNNTLEQESMYGPTDDWVEKQNLDEYSLSKIMGLKVLVNRAIVLHESDPASAQDAVRPVFKLLWTIINNDGELVNEKNTNAVLKSHLKLNAARLVIKLTRNRPVYEKMVTVADYNQLALVIQDPVFRVRQGFAGRIMKYLRAKELHIRYLAVLILAAHEPENEWRLQVRGFLSQQSRAQDNESKLMLNELTLARAMHLLANHPDFIQKSTPEETVFFDHQLEHSVEDLNMTAKYIEFYLETMSNSENVSLIFHITSLVKTFRFANPNDHTQNLYVLSDLSQYLIQERCRSHNWALTSYPGQVKLPRELFIPLGQSDLAVDVSATNYLLEDWVSARQHKSERKHKVTEDRKIGQAAKRRSRSPSPSEADGMNGAEGEKGLISPPRAKRTKSSKTRRVSDEPTRRYAKHHDSWDW
ncbi:hypothetical protein BGZ65_002293 [Modicella reniformis]|uniref:Sister chromatid cohesion protein n=1 Tax=Modicella reniformis TaxID=1440133 RepID=A0A9P6MLM3_9FUNG|nr:hypothetical protein BGZ65_002293 [Modicella reniformis]